jgi:hypothetical protein
LTAHVHILAAIVANGCISSKTFTFSDLTPAKINSSWRKWGRTLFSRFMTLMYIYHAGFGSSYYGTCAATDCPGNTMAHCLML